MANGYQYRSGPWETASKASTASTAIAVLDAVSLTSGQFVITTPGVKCEGVAMESKAVGDALTTAIQYIIAESGRTKWFAETKDGSLATTELGEDQEVQGASGSMGIDATVTTAADLYIHTVISTGTSGQALVIFADPAYHHATN